MIMLRTFGVITYILQDRKEKLLTKYKIMHFIVYGAGVLFIVPFLWKIILSEKIRKIWVISYCDAVTRNKDE